MDLFSFEDMKKIDRLMLGEDVPLELFRAIRLIGMYQGLPMKGKTTTLTVGKKIGQSLPVETLDDVVTMYQQLRIGIPVILEQTESFMRIKVDDCFCKGLPVAQGQLVCDLEGAILEGALIKITGKDLSVYETKCNINGDDYCEYMVRYFE